MSAVRWKKKQKENKGKKDNIGNIGNFREQKNHKEWSDLECESRRPQTENA